MKKTILTVLTCIFAMSLCFSQDVITTKKGEEKEKGQCQSVLL